MNVFEVNSTLPGPTITFGFILATLLGALCHLILGGDARRLALFLLASWLGFLFGHMLGATLGLDIFNVGKLRIVSAMFGSIATLIITQALTSKRTSKRASR